MKRIVCGEGMAVFGELFFEFSLLIYFHRNDQDFTFNFRENEFWVVETNACLHRGNHHFANCFVGAANRGHVIRR